MALGTVTTINIDNISGTVTETESSTEIPFEDSNFPFTGLTIGSVCTFDVDFTQRFPLATNLLPYSPPIAVNSNFFLIL